MTLLPKLGIPLPELLATPGILWVGVFSVFLMAIGIVGIATTLFPIVRLQNEAIAITYVAFRVVECFLLIFGSILYLCLLSMDSMNSTFIGANTELPRLAAKLKLDAFQLSMVTLSVGSTLLCYSFFRSQDIPRWLSIWGMIGYVCLLLSAILDLLGLVSTTSGLGSLLYVPGGLWELLVFPIYLFVRGFSVDLGAGNTIK